MPDLTIEYHYMCTSLESWACQVPSSHGRGYYLVQYHQFEINSPSEGWSCECKSFKFRKKCNHIDQAKAQWCGWHGQFDEGENDIDPKNPKCPRCSAKAVSVACGV